MINQHNSLPEGVQRTLACFNALAIPYDLRIFSEPAHTANQAATLLGCPIGAIVKSLVFLMGDQETLLLVLVSGKNRADLQRLAGIVGEPVHTANPEIVKRLTGFEIGAVPPIGIPGEYPVIIDEDLLAFDKIWSSAGAGMIVVGFSSQDLKKIKRGKVDRIR